MNILFIVNHLRDWPVPIPGVEIVSARNYLMDGSYCERKDTKVFNFCKPYRYQRRSYYVSLLAEARGHLPLPDVKAIEDIQSSPIVQLLAGSLDDVMQSSFADNPQASIDMRIYFGRDAERHYRQLSEQLFNLLHMPLLHARFEKSHNKWMLRNVRALTVSEIPPQEIATMTQAAADCAKGHQTRTREPTAQKPTIAILHSARNTETPSAGAPSNARALQKFQEAAEVLGMRTEIITKDDAERLTQFDALFIRDTTSVNHYTYQFSRQAAVAGLTVIDDPDSILKCTNKVYLAELLNRHRIPMPKTLTIHRDNIAQIVPALGLPCVLKQPDGAFSMGVVKVHTSQELETEVHALLQKSELVLAQEFLPTDFDWRIGIIDREPIFACKYFMAPGHWQIIRHEPDALACEGRTEAIALTEVPPDVLRLAQDAANLIGDGFYGVDLKQRGQHCYIIEINDNPNVDAGHEDAMLHDALYQKIMRVFRKNIEAHKGSIAP